MPRGNIKHRVQQQQKENWDEMRGMEYGKELLKLTRKQVNNFTGLNKIGIKKKLLADTAKKAEVLLILTECEAELMGRTAPRKDKKCRSKKKRWRKRYGSLIICLQKSAK